MTPNRNATVFFQKVYLSSLQDNKNRQICTSFALLKEKYAFSFRERLNLNSLGLDQELCPSTSLELCLQIHITGSCSLS